ncbi:hypothetical protein NPX13_g7443 [Xylaria arbuscula]|uniref:Uncharacterized protein n=1 Tax=Xylaria arbuscula TaxID=114810 RepID=A0A9W8TJH4_9PEZI|nr:hypothetical protein NPX13_g7443 [Xylaria arbuscula]
MNEKDQKLVKDINKLYQQMLIFIEDYLTKATAACPSREYLCLPHPGGHLTFKTRTICTRFDIAQCNDTERRRLLRAFLKYELRCKFYVNDYKPWQLRWSVALGNLGQSDIEAISCVDTYFDSLYKAILAQCGDSDLPESPTVVHAYWEPTVECHCQIGISEQLSDLRGMLYEKVTLNSNELCRWLACFGFDLAATLVAGTTAGQRERAVVGQWLIDVAKRGARRGSDQSNFRHCRHTFSPAISANGMVVEDESYHDSSGLYQMLYPRFTVGRVGYMGDISKHIYCKKISLLYRSRAWAFLDDARLFKYQGEREWPYFLADDAVFPAIRFHDIIGPRQLCEWSWERQRSRPFSPETEIRNLSNAIAQAKV